MPMHPSMFQMQGMPQMMCMPNMGNSIMPFMDPRAMMMSNMQNNTIVSGK